MFNHRIFLKYKIVFIISALFLIVSCKKKCKETEYYNFSNDDLSFLVINNDEINSEPIIVYLTDTVKYLLNSTDTIKAKRTRAVAQNLYSLIGCPKYMIEGKYTLDFFENGIIKNMYIMQEKHDSSCGNEIHREIFVNSQGDVNQSKALIFESRCHQTEIIFNIDTTMFNNNIHLSYKFNFDVNYTSKIKHAVFIKNIGFIRFEDNNSNKLELIV